jgi:hypothetical protein
MVLVTVVIEQRQRETILEESHKRAFSIASNLAALSEGYLLSYNFIKLKQTMRLSSCTMARLPRIVG